MDSNLRLRLEANIRKYQIQKIFTKRLFLPLIAVFLVEEGRVSLEEIALIASITAAVQLVLELPSGYFSDRFGHKQSLVLGTLLAAFSTLAYVISPGFWGGLIASVGFFSGMAFISGAMQAFMHETLLALGRDDEYEKILGKAQGRALYWNVVLILLVTLTYSIHPFVPFLVGFAGLFVSFIMMVRLTVPPVRIPVREVSWGIGEKLRMFTKSISWLRLFAVFLLFAVTTAGFNYATMYREIVFRGFGLPAEQFGIYLAIGSLLAAFVAGKIHFLKSLRPGTFYILDVVYLVGVLALVGVTRDPVWSVFVFALFPAYGRSRQIIYDAQILREFQDSNRKSTILSVMRFLKSLNGIWIPILFSFSISVQGLLLGHVVFGALLGAIGVVLLMLFYLSSRFEKQIPASVQ